MLSQLAMELEIQQITGRKVPIDAQLIVGLLYTCGIALRRVAPGHWCATLSAHLGPQANAPWPPRHTYSGPDPATAICRTVIAHHKEALQ